MIVMKQLPHKPHQHIKTFSVLQPSRIDTRLFSFLLLITWRMARAKRERKCVCITSTCRRKYLEVESRNISKPADVNMGLTSLLFGLTSSPLEITRSVLFQDSKGTRDVICEQLVKHTSCQFPNRCFNN